MKLWSERRDVRSTSDNVASGAMVLYAVQRGDTRALVDFVMAIRAEQAVRMHIAQDDEHSERRHADRGAQSSVCSDRRFHDRSLTFLNTATHDTLG